MTERMSDERLAEIRDRYPVMDDYETAMVFSELHAEARRAREAEAASQRGFESEQERNAVLRAEVKRLEERCRRLDGRTA